MHLFPKFMIYIKDDGPEPPYHACILSFIVIGSSAQKKNNDFYGFYHV